MSFESDAEDLKDDVSIEFEELFEAERIVLDEIICSFEDEMSLYELGIYKHWDKEYITLRSNSSD
ncbi:MAG: hypothetical protein JEY71_11510 [Sphaerochaeta sp.]|nr:hypothetical protein [Sphaerochaeta sp.]